MPATTPPRATVKLPLGEREVELYEPHGGQILVLTRLPRMADRGEAGDGQANVDMLMAFGDVIEALIVYPADRAYAYQGLAEGTVQLDQYADLALAVLRHFNITQDEPAAPRTGPRPTKRAARRPR